MLIGSSLVRKFSDEHVSSDEESSNYEQGISGWSLVKVFAKAAKSRTARRLWLQSMFFNVLFFFVSFPNRCLYPSI